MELRLATEHYGQKVTVYTEKNGNVVKDTTIIILTLLIEQSPSIHTSGL